MARPSPSRRRRSFGGSLLLAAAALAAAACDRGPSSADDPLAVEAANAGMAALLVDGPTARRVAAHRLTADRVERWFAAQEALDAQAADDPAAAAPRIAPRGDAVERAVAALEARPGATAAIRDAGLDVEEFVLTGLALHQALTAAAPAAPAAVRRLAARNVRFVADNADLLARFRTQRPARVAVSPAAPDSTWWYDPFADSLVYGVAPAAAPLPDAAGPDSLPRSGDSLPPVAPPMPEPAPPPAPPPVVAPVVPVVPPPGVPPRVDSTRSPPSPSASAPARAPLPAAPLPRPTPPPPPD